MAVLKLILVLIVGFYLARWLIRASVKGAAWLLRKLFDHLKTRLFKRTGDYWPGP